MAAGSRSLEVLVVDDDVRIGRLIGVTLGKTPFNVMHATDAELALTMVAERRPRVILLDVMLPGMDGVELCRRIKSDPETARIPILMITARDDDETRRAAFKAGADEYVVKPFSLRRLLELVYASIGTST